VEEIVGILSGDVESDEEVDGTVPRGELFELLSEQAVAVSGFGEGEFGCSGLEVVGEEDGIVSVA
jgi:hypothetical protein